MLSARRDRQLIDTLATRVRACARSTRVLVCVDGLSSYVGAITWAFSERVRSGKRGRPPRVCPPGLLLAQVVKTSVKRRVVDVSRRIVLGHPDAVAQVLTTASGGQHQINTAYIERLNATFRACMAPLARRTRTLALREAVLNAGMFLVGTAAEPAQRRSSEAPDAQTDEEAAVCAPRADHGQAPELWRGPPGAHAQCGASQEQVPQQPRRELPPTDAAERTGNATV